ncbi:MAG: glucose-1-phosphate cytidylyltransferase [Lentisphaerae bacterium GWF2_45_14]|nr:MAG: glucose-1-phosphate cytidylyltransferase [Lentisphaerae bacterium GWF2_45_14]
MQAVILAGGMGTRISEESHLRPKPMIEIGGRPILWHIMKIYHTFGISDFIVCLGYKGYVIKEYFSNYFLHMSDVTFDMASNSVEIHHKYAENWRITLVDTGLGSGTGGRLKRVGEYLNKGSFCFTYGDGLSNVPIDKLIKFHKSSGKSATMTAVQPPGRYGSVDIAADGHVSHFMEKPAGDGGWINGGFFVLEPSVLDLISGDSCSWEGDIVPELAREGNLAAYCHEGFWLAMDTMRDKTLLDGMWDTGKAQWKVWEN